MGHFGEDLSSQSLDWCEIKPNQTATKVKHRKPKQIQQEAQLPQRLHTMHEMAIQGHSRSSVIVPIDTAYMTSY